MKTSLSHLPDDKQDELGTLTKIIVEQAPAEMVILFGSHARGDWVEDFQENTEYVSDYDILVITKGRKSAKANENWWDLKKVFTSSSHRTILFCNSFSFHRLQAKNSRHSRIRNSVRKTSF